jgi:curli biogenesis system outer membrane secretion channel CsgG
MRTVKICVVGTLLAAGCVLGQSAPKKRVAILNFEYGTVQSTISSIFNSNVDVGNGIADMLVEKLVGSGVYSVYERKALEKIMAEQNFSNSDRADPNSAAKIGRLLGVDAIIIGSITQFGRDDKQTNVGGGAIGGITRRYGIGGVGRREAKAVVAISARMVDVDTGEIKAIASGQGESSRSGTTLLGSGGSSSTAAGGVYDMRSSNFANSILGEATRQAVDTLAAQLDGNAGRVQGRVVKIDGLVADVSGKTLVLNVGSRSGVKVGDKLSIRRMSREIKDPATGRVIRRVEETIGELTITEVDEQSAVGTFSGAGTPRTGDSVKSN